jgi:hypothetical protein
MHRPAQPAGTRQPARSRVRLQKGGARSGPAKVGGFFLLLRGLSQLVATIAAPLAAPVIAAVRLPGRNAGSPQASLFRAASGRQ